VAEWVGVDHDEADESQEMADDVRDKTDDARECAFAVGPVCGDLDNAVADRVSIGRHAIRGSVCDATRLIIILLSHGRKTWGWIQVAAFSRE